MSLHVGIPGSGKADKAAKSALNKLILRISIQISNLLWKMMLTFIHCLRYLFTLLITMFFLFDYFTARINTYEFVIFTV